MSENNPYLIDVYPCSVCQKDANYECPSCNLFFCKSCVTERKGFLRCSKCGGRLYPTSETRKRFVGSVKPMNKFNGNILKKQKVVPKIFPKADRERIFSGGETE